MINDTLNDREQTHGSYVQVANLTQALLMSMSYSKNWEELFPIQKEALHMIAVKIARILEGNADEVDHWHDVSGYSALVERFLTQARPGNTQSCPEQ